MTGDDALAAALVCAAAWMWQRFRGHFALETHYHFHAMKRAMLAPWDFAGRTFSRGALMFLLAGGALFAGCSEDDGGGPAVDAGGVDSGATPDAGGLDVSLNPDTGMTDLTVVAEDPADQPLGGLDPAALDRFFAGDGIFDLSFRRSDGLGPLYIRTSCAACHADGGRGPGSVQKFTVLDVATMAPVKDAPEMVYGGTERPYAVAGATHPLLAPTTLLDGHRLWQSRRAGPTVMGRGYMEAVLDSEIERVAAEQAVRTDAIHGRINRVTYHSHPQATVAVSHALGETNVIGRFGLKARVATLDDFAADAFQGDMGLTSPMRPDELANPDGLHDDEKAGADLALETVTTVAAYVRTIAIPSRAAAQANQAGQAAFAKADCAVCHVPALKTRADFPVAQLANVDAPIFTDLLLHDMGDDLADYLTDEAAEPREWRTAPLVALRFQRAFLHDGRAHTIEEAIVKHAGPGSQANGSVEKFNALGAEERAALLSFVQGL
jgi:mono/diheme cytochrome c family protein